MTENKIKHLEFIQDIINRMSNNSFMLKGWAVTLVAGIFTISSRDADKMYFLVAYIPIMIFWFLDSYYLKQEHLYRCLYEDVRQKKEEEIDFSLNAAHYDTKPVSEYINCLVSSTEKWFYPPLAILCTGIIIITHI